MPALYKRTLTPTPGKEDSWRCVSRVNACRLFKAGSRASRAAASIDHALAGAPYGALWQAVWQGRVSIHWAFWSLFVAPLFLFSMLAVTFKSPLMLGVIDLITVIWVAFAITLIWRSGAMHSGWAFTPNLYRLAMVIYATPLVLIVAGIFVSGLTL